jgi:hypothetical protein
MEQPLFLLPRKGAADYRMRVQIKRNTTSGSQQRHMEGDMMLQKQSL